VSPICVFKMGSITGSYYAPFLLPLTITSHFPGTCVQWLHLWYVTLLTLFGWLTELNFIGLCILHNPSLILLLSYSGLIHLYVSTPNQCHCYVVDSFMQVGSAKFNFVLICNLPILAREAEITISIFSHNLRIKEYIFWRCDTMLWLLHMKLKRITH
jgi:hypothetical protein